MITQSNLFPMAVKTLTRASDSASVTVIPGSIMSAATQGTGTILLMRNEQGSISPLVVTEAIATVILDTILFQVTPVGALASKYIRADTVASVEPRSASATLYLLSDDGGFDHGASLQVTESVSTINTRINAAIIAGGGLGGGSTQTLTALGTNQATAAAVTARNVRIDSASAAGTGIRLDAATAGETHFIYNASTKAIAVYPAVGEFIDPELVNQPLLLGANESLFLGSTLAGRWSATVAVSSIQNVTPSGTVQGGGLIREGVTQAVVTGAAFGQTAVTLPAATVGSRINVNNIGGSAALRLFPLGTNQINGGGAGVMTNLHADSSIDLMCSQDGLWVDVVTYINTLYVDNLGVKAAGGTISVKDSSGGNIAGFGSNINFEVGLQFSRAEGTATVGGVQADGFQITTNFVEILTCATIGDSLTLAGDGNFVIIKNSGAAPAYVYCALGGTMNGVSNGYVIVAPRQTYQLDGIGDGSVPYAWYSTLLNSPGGQYTALAGTPPHLVHPSLTLTTVAAPLAEVILDAQQPYVVIVNAGANVALLLPPAGGDTLNGAASLQLPQYAVAHVQKTADASWTATFLAPGLQVATANVGSSQATGTPIVSTAVVCTTCANAGDAYTIQQYTPRMVYFKNKGANPCDVFPPLGGTIDVGGVNIAFSVPNATAYIFTSNDGIAWEADLQ